MPRLGTSETTAAVDAFMAALDHPQKPAFEHLRSVMLDVDPSIGEGIEWNAPALQALLRQWIAFVA